MMNYNSCNFFDRFIELLLSLYLLFPTVLKIFENNKKIYMSEYSIFSLAF